MRRWSLLSLFAAVYSVSPFITTWRTTSPNESISFPLNKPPPAMIIVDWGDGQMSNTTTLPLTHVYTASGFYNVSISDGAIYGFGFNDTGDKLKLVDIVSWGDNFFMDATSTRVFAGCSNLHVSASPFTQPQFVYPATLEGMFINSSFNSPLNWNLTNITSLAAMFRGAFLFNQPLNFTTSNSLKTVEEMFAFASAFNSPLNFTTTFNVTSFKGMFKGALAFNQPISFQTDSAGDMREMFRNASSFNQPVNFNTSRVSMVDHMFNGAFAFNQPINFDALSLTRTISMFIYARAFNSSVQLANTLNMTSTADRKSVV